MKYSQQITIDRPRELVTRLFIDPSLLGEYQEGFERKELVSGTPGEKGAVSMMYYKSGKHSMELEETVITNDLPSYFEAVYKHVHMDNSMKCTFEELPGGRTLYTSEYHYTRINWIMPRLISILFPSMYRKPGQRWLDHFKNYVEAYEDS